MNKHRSCELPVITPLPATVRDRRHGFDSGPRPVSEPGSAKYADGPHSLPAPASIQRTRPSRLPRGAVSTLRRKTRPGTHLRFTAARREEIPGVKTPFTLLATFAWMRLTQAPSAFGRSCSARRRSSRCEQALFRRCRQTWIPAFCKEEFS